MKGYIHLIVAISLSALALLSSCRHTPRLTRLYNNIFSDFKNDLPDLKEADYRLFLFCILGLSTDSISLLLKETNKAAVYNRKKRLKEKIRKLDAQKQGKYFNFSLTH